MRNSFGFKLGISITLLTVGLTLSSLYYFYLITSGLVSRQIAGRLKDIGSTSTFLFTPKDRQSIINLNAEIDKKAQFSMADLAKLPPGGTLNSLTPENIKIYQSTKEFQDIVQILRKIHYASLHKVTPLKDFYPQKFAEYPDAVLPYILVAIPESPDHQFLKFLASFAPEPEGDIWQGNPIGNLYVPSSLVFHHAFEGEMQVAKEYYVDTFYTSITAAIPIKDQQGKTIALLCLDYLAGSGQDQLKNLRYIGAIIIIISLISSILLSILLARYLSYPIQQLQIAAQAVKNQNYNVTVNIKRKDELGLLAEIFNQMVIDVRNYAENLEQKVQIRTVELQEANQKLHKMATLDGLTGIFNRGYFDEYLQKEWDSAKYSQSWLSVIFCDIDYFKAYNDTYGHLSGDQCLREVAQTISECLNRSTDLVARYGGEEFVIVLPNTDLKGALEVAKQIRMKIKSMRFKHKNSPVSDCVTLSFGVASIIPRENNIATCLIKLADKALYQAKEEGRDRIFTS